MTQDTLGTTIVIVWLVLTGMGLVLTSYMMKVSWGDVKNLKRAGLNGELQALSRLAMWQEARRFVIKLVLFLIGVASFSEHPKHSTDPIDGYGWFFIAVFYGSVILLNYSSIAAIRYRRRFIAHREREGRVNDPSLKG